MGQMKRQEICTLDYDCFFFGVSALNEPINTHLPGTLQAPSGRLMHANADSGATAIHDEQTCLSMLEETQNIF